MLSSLNKCRLFCEQPGFPAAGGGAGGDVGARAQGVPAVRDGLQQPAARRARQPAPPAHRRAQGKHTILASIDNGHRIVDSVIKRERGMRLRGREGERMGERMRR